MNIAIVDPFISGDYLASKITKDNIKCIALLTNKAMANEMQLKGRFNPQEYIECICLNEVTDDQLQTYFYNKNILTIIAGTEYTLDLADKLNNLFELKLANPTATTRLRANKSSILKTLIENNIAVPKTHIIDLEDLDFAQKLHEISEVISFPAFVKPCSSGGSFAIKRCKTAHALEIFLNQSQGKKYALSPGQIKKYIIQKFIDAPEYVVNVTSYAGKHYISGIWSYEKIYLDDNIPIYKQAAIVNLPKDTAILIQEFIENSLDAIDNIYGFSHIELFLLDTRPVMVEINLRLPGVFGLFCELEILAYGSDQVRKFLDLKNNKSVNNNLHTNNSATLLFINSKSPCVVPEFLIEDFQNIESFVKLMQAIPPGTVMKSIKKLSDTLLYVALYNSSNKKLEHDIKLIHQILTKKYYLCL